MANLFDVPTPAPVAGKVVRLLGLRLENFKGLTHFDLELDGKNATIRGDNAVGKTTLFDAFLWLLFDKDSGNRKDFDIKTLGPDGEPAHGLEHEVEGAFSVGAKTLTLRKVYAEQWTKRRGSAEQVFTGHATEHFIDGVPVRKADYDARVAAIADEKVFRLLTNPAYFNEQLTWQERRKLLLEVCGDIPDEAVITSDPGLAGLSEILGSRSLEDHRKVLAASRTKINKDLGQIPIRISEVQRGLPGVTDAASAEKDLADARVARQKKLDEKATIAAGGETGQKRVRLAEVEAAILTLENEARRSRDAALSVKRQEKSTTETALSDGQRAVKNLEASLADSTVRAEGLDTELEVLRVKFRTAAAEDFTHTDEMACPACGQALPEEMVEEARARALAAFNARRAEALAKLDADGKALRAPKDQADAEIERLKGQVTVARAGLPALQENADAAKAQGFALDAAPLELGPAYGSLAAERDGLKASIEAAQAGAPEAAAVDAEISVLDDRVADAERQISQAAHHDRDLARIEELKADERRLAAEFERLEHELYLTEEFVRAKVRLLTDRINSRFSLARFKLFDVQVNGAISECCETTVGGVPYGSALNRGARLNVGLDIISTLSEHYGFRAPIWVDNAEAVTRLIPVKTQLIRLVVSESDQVLRIEKEAS